MTTFADTIADIYDRLEELEARPSLLARLKRLHAGLKVNHPLQQALTQSHESVDEVTLLLHEQQDVLVALGARLDLLAHRCALPLETVTELSHDASPCSRCGAPSVGETSGRGVGIDAPATEGCAS